MKKGIILLSYIGVGLMGGIIGAERQAKKVTNSFWYKFVFQTIGLLILLLAVPGCLYWGVIDPCINDDSVLRSVVEVLFSLYLYGSGVFICWWQVHLKEKST